MVRTSVIVVVVVAALAVFLFPRQWRWHDTSFNFTTGQTWRNWDGVGAHLDHILEQQHI
jgi:hypothetical protein